MVQITFRSGQEARELVNRAVAERGEEYRYPGTRPGRTDVACVYFFTDEDEKPVSPGCIIGQVMAYKGLTAEQVDQAGFNDGVGVGELAQAGYLQAPSRVIRALEQAQFAQDCGQTWGYARDEFERVLAGGDEDE